MKKLITLFTFLCFVMVFTTCSKSGGGGGSTNVDCSTVSNKAFTADVNPVIQTFCNIPNCHAAGSQNGPGPLTNYNEVFNARALVRSVIASGTMPKMATLSANQRNSITCWIDSGAPPN